MFFQINKLTVDTLSLGRHDFYAWTYCEGTPDSPGTTVAQSPGASLVGSFADEQACRRSIAAARKAFAGARFAKVVGGDAE